MMDAERAHELLHEAYRLAEDEDDIEAAARLAQQVVDGLGDDEALLKRDAEMVLAHFEVQERRDEAARARLERLRRDMPEESDAHLLLAQLLLLRWEFAEAERVLQACEPDEDSVAELLYERAVVAEMMQRFDEAEQLYQRAAALDSVHFPAPVRMSDDDAQQLLTNVVDAFPGPVRDALNNVQIDLVDLPAPAIDGGPDTDPLLLGLYQGEPIGEPAAEPIGMPGRIRVFKRNIERLAVDPENLVEQLTITLLHEVGHHLGWDEDDLEERGLG